MRVAKRLSKIELGAIVGNVGLLAGVMMVLVS